MSFYLALASIARMSDKAANDHQPSGPTLQALPSRHNMRRVAHGQAREPFQRLAPRRAAKTDAEVKAARAYGAIKIVKQPRIFANAARSLLSATIWLGQFGVHQ
jgi:hypothetical protein